jgi:DNA-binding XRE family transcriptional regulator
MLIPFEVHYFIYLNNIKRNLMIYQPKLNLNLMIITKLNLASEEIYNFKTKKIKKVRE